MEVILSEEAKKNKAEKAKEKPIWWKFTNYQRGVIEVLLERSEALQAESQVRFGPDSKPCHRTGRGRGLAGIKDQILLKLESDRQYDYEQSKSQLIRRLWNFNG